MPGPAIAELALRAEPAAWRAAGFVVGETGECVLGATLLRIVAASPDGHSGLVGWKLTGAGPTEVDGVPTAWVEHASRLEETPAHPNTATSVDHVVLASSALGKTVAALEHAGMVLRRTRDVPGADRPFQQAFFRHGEATLEVVGPLAPEGDEHARLWGLTLTVADLDVAATLLGDRLGAISDAVQPGRRIATMTREAGLGTRVALMSPPPDPAR